MTFQVEIAESKKKKKIQYLQSISAHCTGERQCTAIKETSVPGRSKVILAENVRPHSAQLTTARLQCVFDCPAQVQSCHLLKMYGTLYRGESDIPWAIEQLKS